LFSLSLLFSNYIYTFDHARDATRLNGISVKELHFHSLSNHDDSDDHSIKAQSKDFHILFSLVETLIFCNYLNITK
jgi:hypothetical protein